MNPILILELIMLGMGLWILFKGQLPRMLYNDEKYHILAPDARLLGLTLLLPLPVSFVWLTSLTLLFGEGGERAGIRGRSRHPAAGARHWRGTCRYRRRLARDRSRRRGERRASAGGGFVHVPS